CIIIDCHENFLNFLAMTKWWNLKPFKLNGFTLKRVNLLFVNAHHELRYNSRKGFFKDSIA
ncbi:hypothetical protein, partial [Helicobacter rodentium]|uniref:hypothetical protein n=1 Tax=Helicobacter rodentium TaxID=59617 RepID=UPI00263942BE